MNIPNLDRLISHLEGLPEERFNITSVFKAASGIEDDRGSFNECGTAACIAGWALVLMGDHTEGSRNAGKWLGLEQDDFNPLFMPFGWSTRRETYPLSRAIRTLKHMRSEYLRTGQVVVDWDAPEPEAKPAWTAPKAVEQTKPALPAEIVRFLRPADLEVVS